MFFFSFRENLCCKNRNFGAIFELILFLQQKYTMCKKTKIGFLALTAMLLLTAISCCKQEKNANSPLVGHWGCEQYVSCRTDSTGYEKWETFQYEVGEGHGYEVYFYADGSGKLLLNDSPALIKKFNCDYHYDSTHQILTIYNTSWIISAFSDATSADMNIEELTDNTITASWTNYFSEPTPFFERFFLRRID